MVLCFVALAVFAFLGVFSARYRSLAREAFACVARRVTLRPCESGLEERLKATIVAKTITRAPRVAAFVNRRFEILSWVFTILFFASLIYSGYSVYNYAVYGNCNGPQGGWCPIDVFVGSGQQRVLKAPLVGNSPIVGPVNASITVIEFGCFTCPSTRTAEPVVQEFLAKHGWHVRFAFKYFPLPNHAWSNESAEAAECAREQGKFWEYKKVLFENSDHEPAALKRLAIGIGLNSAQFDACLDSKKYYGVVASSFREGIESGISGTPTFFFNNVSVVGVPTMQQLEDALAGKASGSGAQVCTPPK
jgi:protein-disulfide isomerase